MGATRAEEASTRAELLLTRPVRRWRWLGGPVLGLAAGATSAGAAAGGADVTAGDAFAAVSNAPPTVTVLAGPAVLLFGVGPPRLLGRATVLLAAYVLEVVGPLMEWPDAIQTGAARRRRRALALPPARGSPGPGFRPPAAIATAAVGLVLAAAGILAFQRRDLVDE